jgi:hypothetical protein
MFPSWGQRMEGGRRLYSKYGRIILVGLCLGLYLAFVRVMWVSRENPGAGRAQEITAVAGREFRLLWTASVLARQEEPAAVYDPGCFREQEIGLSGEPRAHLWLYPPPFLLLVWPLSYLSYPAALAAWLGLTLLAYALVLRRICPEPRRLVEILCFPGIAINFLIGHNGFLSGALLGAGLLFLDISPVLAGIGFGLLFYKPQLAVLVPVALIAGGRWRVLGWTMLAAAALALASALVLGAETWWAFFHNLPLRLKVTDGPRFWEKMPTVYAGVRAAGGSPALAWGLAAVILAGAVAGVARVWSRRAAPATRAAILVVGTLLASRYAFLYDYAILALPLAWLWQAGRSSGWLAGEKPLLLWTWLMPLVSLALMTGLDWPASLVAVPTLGALFVLILRRHYREARPESRGAGEASRQFFHIYGK